MFLVGLAVLWARAPTAHAAASSTPLSWEAARAEAQALVAQMSATEKASLMLGTGWSEGTLTKWHFVGNIPPIARLGVPPLNMMDAAGGFRTYWTELVGTVTCWPSLLSLGASWDPGLVQRFGAALGAEFSGKGANTILGPSVNVHRVARNGRNFEYLSGEDPYLGSRLVPAYVQGVQAAGVMAVTKHYALNQQETHRESASSVVDDATKWQLYYPPFEAAVRAGASGVMCSYNKVNGTYACADAGALARDLKGTMGFRGFVQSDWGATHSAASVTAGLDQEMPMTYDYREAGVLAGRYYYDARNLAAHDGAAVDEAATRILTPVARLRLLNRSYCSPPCEAALRANVTSAAHAALARAAAAASIVLLQNDGVLPLSAAHVRSLAIIGAAADARAYDPAGASQGQGGWHQGDYYSGGGSGHVTAGAALVTPLQGIAARARAAGIAVSLSPTSDVGAAVDLARTVDVAIVVGGTTSGESVDRPNLSLDSGADALIAAVAAAAPKTVALVAAPGAFLTPWRAEVAAAAVLFLGGQESGSAWADVLFGDVAPTGRLPITLPASEEQTIPPSRSRTVRYTEGLATGYRATSARAQPAFPFGHGLSYTSFAFGAPRVGSSTCSPVGCERPAGEAACVLCAVLPVTNVGNATAAAVPQLYLEVPAAGWPVPLLRGFQKTNPIAPGDLVDVPFCLTARDLSFYRAGAWVRAAAATAHFGASSADLRASLRLPLDGEQLGEQLGEMAGAGAAGGAEAAAVTAA